MDNFKENASDLQKIWIHALSTGLSVEYKEPYLCLSNGRRFQINDAEEVIGIEDVEYFESGQLKSVTVVGFS